MVGENATGLGSFHIEDVYTCISGWNSSRERNPFCKKKLKIKLADKTKQVEKRERGTQRNKQTGTHKFNSFLRLQSRRLRIIIITKLIDSPKRKEILLRSVELT